MRSLALGTIGAIGRIGAIGALACCAHAAPGANPQTAPTPTPMPDLTLDHVLVGFADLDEGIRRLTALTGVAPARGGRHPGRGTQNALLSLGPHTYLELIAPVPDSPPQGPMALLAQLHELTPIGWAVGTHRFEAAIGRLQTDGLRAAAPAPGSRQRPDGQLLQWRTAALEPAGDLNPFLIEWSAATVHPATDSPAGCTFVALAILGPESATAGLDRLAADIGGGVTVQRAAAPGLRLTIRCPAGLVTLPPT